LASFIHNPKEFWSGVMFLAFGLAAVYIGQDYKLGTAGRMGPGYFPTILGGILAFIGLVEVIRSFLSKGEVMERFAIKETALVLLAVVLFGFLVRGAGAVISVFLLVLVSAYASRDFKWKSTILVAIGAAIFCVLVFTIGLGLPIPAFGPWFNF
jgi:hypothetical protein